MVTIIILISATNFITTTYHYYYCTWYEYHDYNSDPRALSVPHNRRRLCGTVGGLAACWTDTSSALSCSSCAVCRV